MKNNNEEKKKKKILKFESEERKKELKHFESLDLLELNNDSVALEIGSGTGLFIFEAAKNIKEAISIEKNPLMTEIQRDKILNGSINNVKILEENIDNKRLSFPSNFFDGVILSTIIHEIENKDLLINEIYRVLKEKAKVVLIEFKKEDIDKGPPIEEKVSEESMKELFIEKGFKLVNLNSDMNCFYRMVFEK